MNLYRLSLGDTTDRKGRSMTFRPNYRRDRLERGRAARARSEEKQKKKEEKTAQRKAERTASEVTSEGEKD
jgi:hypothetical protein